MIWNWQYFSCGFHGSNHPPSWGKSRGDMNLRPWVQDPDWPAQLTDWYTFQSRIVYGRTRAKQFLRTVDDRKLQIFVKFTIRVEQYMKRTKAKMYFLLYNSVKKSSIYGSLWPKGLHLIFTQIDSLLSFSFWSHDSPLIWSHDCLLFSRWTNCNAHIKQSLGLFNLHDQIYSTLFLSIHFREIHTKPTKANLWKYNGNPTTLLFLTLSFLSLLDILFLTSLLEHSWVFVFYTIFVKTHYKLKRVLCCSEWDPKIRPCTPVSVIEDPSINKRATFYVFYIIFHNSI